MSAAIGFGGPVPTGAIFHIGRFQITVRSDEASWTAANRGSSVHRRPEQTLRKLLTLGRT